MSVTSVVSSVNKETPTITVTPSESIILQDKTIEEKRLKLALDLRRF